MLWLKKSDTGVWKMLITEKCDTGSSVYYDGRFGKQSVTVFNYEHANVVQFVRPLIPGENADEITYTAPFSKCFVREGFVVIQLILGGETTDKLGELITYNKREPNESDPKTVTRSIETKPTEDYLQEECEVHC